MARLLRLGRNLLLPLDAVTETFAYLAKRGAGKSYAASVVVEQMLEAGLQVVILDPMGIWYGLRTKADGKSPGFEIPILGGDHGDIPLESTGGKYVADLIVADRFSAVLDVSHFSKGERKRFVADFAERLYRKNREAMHLVLEEADMFAPQKPQHGEQRMLGAIEDLVRRGRGRGIGISLISQRSAVLNKDVLTQTECLVALRTTAPHDRKAIKDWIDAHADRDEQKKVLDSLPGLPIGTAWFWSPGWLEQLQKVKINKKRTLDTGATPKAGVKRRPQKTVAEVDLAQLTQQMSDTIERAKAVEPAHLNREIRRLQSDLDSARKAAEIDIDPLVAEAVADINAQWQKTFDEQSELVGRLRARADATARFLYETGHEILGHREDLVDDTEDPKPPEVEIPKTEPSAMRASTKARKQSRSTSPAPAGTKVDADVLTKAGPRKCLIAIAQYPDGVVKNQLCALTQYAPRSVETHMSTLRIAGMVMNGWPAQVTAEGLAALGDDYEPLPTGARLLEHWKTILPAGPRRVLELIAGRHNDGIEKAELIDQTDYAPRSIETHTSTLRVRKLIEKRGRRFYASQELFDG